MAYFLELADDLWRQFASERQPGWKNIVQLFALCSGVSLAATTFLFLAAYSLLVDYPVFFVPTVTLLWIALSIGLYFFKHLRCFFAVFFLSCGLREGRNTLIAVGSGVVVASHIQSIFYNLKQLADNVSCILDSQHFSFLNHYIKAIWWIYCQSKMLSNPLKDVVAVDDKMNVSYLVSDEDLKTKLNMTKLYLQDVTNQISSVLALQPYLGKKVLPLVGTAFVLFGTYNFLRKFLRPHNLKFKNTYITKGFVRYNEQLWQQGKLSVLPLSKEEKKLYAAVPSFCQTHKERKQLVRFFLPVLANICIWAFFAAVDYLLYWLIFSVTKHLRDFPELEVHLKLYYHKNADKFIFNRGEIVDGITSFKMALFEDSCIPAPRFSHSETWIQLAAIIFFLTGLGLMTSSLMQLKILVATSFFPERGMKRVEYLHSKLLNRRSKPPEKNMKMEWNSFAMVNFQTAWIVVPVLEYNILFQFLQITRFKFSSCAEIKTGVMSVLSAPVLCLRIICE